MRKPSSPICQVIRSWLSGMTAARKSRSAMPVASAVTRAAAQPSPNSRKDSTVSMSETSCRCSEHSSRLTTSTRADASDRTACCASRSAGTAAEQPMKPTSVRATSARSPSRSPSCRSSPGAVKPVQDATTRWVIRCRSAAMPSASTARSANSSAWVSYNTIRAPVRGNRPRR